MFGQEVKIFRFQEQEEACLATPPEASESFDQGGFLVGTSAGSFSRGSLQLTTSS